MEIKPIVIAITGPESTGKSELSLKLAAHFNTVFVAEQSRIYLNSIGQRWTYEDVLNIAEMQWREEQRLRHEEHKILFCDTEQIALKVWLEFYGLKCPDAITERIESSVYHHTLLMDIDLPWQPDPLRENPNDRAELLQRFINELERYKKPYTLISGEGEQRFRNALEVVESFMV